MRSFKAYALLGVAVAVLLSWSAESSAYDRYNDGCNSCHGSFTGSTSMKGSVFPSGDKHTMHRSSSNMNADCDLCHTAGDGKDPFMGSSNGTSNNIGYGCVGCHGRVEDAGFDGLSPGLGAGLRQHHYNAGTWTGCQNCHADANSTNYTPVGEQFKPPYYGTVDTNADMSCNPDQVADSNENWTIGEFVGTDNDGDGVYDGSDTDCPPAAKTAGDFAFDGRADILWRNISTGQNWLYLMDGALIDGSESINTVANLQWEIVGKGDYDGNGTADILWRNSSTGQNWMYLMVGSRIFSSVLVNTVANTQWQIVGSGDYNGDGNDDILWRNSVTGQNWMYLMAGSSIDSSSAVNRVGNLDWQIVGSGDFDNDGNSDILMRNRSTGQNWMYLMDGSSIINGTIGASVNTVSNPDTHVAGIGDFNNDGNDDILWHNDVSGKIWVYFMNGSTISSFPHIVTVANTDWEVAGDGDYDGDGDADIHLRNGVTGQNWVYLMDGAAIFDSTPINTVSNTQWRVVNFN